MEFHHRLLSNDFIKIVGDDCLGNEKLIVWEPLKPSTFDRFMNEMDFVKMSYEEDFILIFQNYKTNEQFTFTYKLPHSGHPVLTFRFTDEMARSDIESLIGQLAKENFNRNIKLHYEPTFYKVENSSYLAWYDSVFSARPILHPNAEHHLYITSNFFIDVLSEYEPIISVNN